MAGILHWYTFLETLSYSPPRKKKLAAAPRSSVEKGLDLIRHSKHRRANASVFAAVSLRGRYWTVSQVWELWFALCVPSRFRK